MSWCWLMIRLYIMVLTYDTIVCHGVDLWYACMSWYWLMMRLFIWCVFGGCCTFNVSICVFGGCCTFNVSFLSIEIDFWRNLQRKKEKPNLGHCWQNTNCALKKNCAIFLVWTLLSFDQQLSTVLVTCLESVSLTFTLFTHVLNTSPTHSCRRSL